MKYMVYYWVKDMLKAKVVKHLSKIARIQKRYEIYDVREVF